MRPCCASWHNDGMCLTLARVWRVMSWPLPAPRLTAVGPTRRKSNSGWAWLTAPLKSFFSLFLPGRPFPPPHPKGIHQSLHTWHLHPNSPPGARFMPSVEWTGETTHWKILRPRPAHHLPPVPFSTSSVSTTMYLRGCLVLVRGCHAQVAARSSTACNVGLGG